MIATLLYISSLPCVEPIVSTLRAYPGAPLQISTLRLIVILYMAFTSLNWCIEAGAGGDRQECQLSVPEALPPAHLIKGQIDGPAGSITSIKEGPSGNCKDCRKLGRLNNPPF